MANILGNLVNRTISMAHKYLNGEVMAPSVYEDIDKELIDCVLSTKSKVDKDMDDLRIANALDDILIFLEEVISILMKQCHGF